MSASSITEFWIMACERKSLMLLDFLGAKKPSASKETSDAVRYWRKQAFPDNWLSRLLHPFPVMKYRIWKMWKSAEELEHLASFYENLLVVDPEG